MMSKNNERRIFIEAERNCILSNLLSSFIVSDLFEDGQYEILSLPNDNDLVIVERINNEVNAEFLIKEK